MRPGPHLRVNIIEPTVANRGLSDVRNDGEAVALAKRLRAYWKEYGKLPFDAMPDQPAAESCTYADGYSAFLYLGPLEDESFSRLIPNFYSPDFVKEGYEIRGCGVCGHRFTDPGAAPDRHVAAEYGDDYFFSTGASSCSRPTFMMPDNAFSHERRL